MLPNTSPPKPLVTWVILTIALWQNPHGDEVCNKHDSSRAGMRPPTDGAAICYSNYLETCPARELRREACTVDEGGSGGSGAGIQIESPDKLQAARSGLFLSRTRLCINL